MFHKDTLTKLNQLLGRWAWLLSKLFIAQKEKGHLDYWPLASSLWLDGLCVNLISFVWFDHIYFPHSLLDACNHRRVQESKKRRKKTTMTTTKRPSCSSSFRRSLYYSLLSERAKSLQRRERRERMGNEWNVCVSELGSRRGCDESGKKTREGGRESDCDPSLAI